MFFLGSLQGFFTCESNGDEMGFTLWELNMARSKSTNEMEVYSWKNHLPSGKLTGISPFLMGKLTINGHFQ
jgi:hypothetical protein